MAYFPESHAGEFYADAIGSVGNDIGQAIQYYRQSHEQASQIDSLFQNLAGMNHPDGKPYIDKKAQERIGLLTGMEKARAEGGYLAAMEIANKLDSAGRDAAYKEAATKHMERLATEPYDVGQIVYDDQGRAIGRRNPKGGIDKIPTQYLKTPEQQAADEIAEHPAEQAAKETKAMREGRLQPGRGQIEETPEYPAPGSWQEKFNKTLKNLLGDNWWSRNLGFVPEHEVRRAVRPPDPNAGVQVGQPQPPGGIGQPAMNPRNDPKVKRIKDMYQTGKFGPVGSKEALKMAHQMIQALGYTDDTM